MRSLLMAAFAAAGLALAATSGVSAAPIAPIGKGAEVIDSRAVVYYYHRHRIIIAAAGGTTVTATAAGGETRGKSGGRCTFRRAAAEREFFLGGAITGNSAARCGLTPALQLYLGIGSASFPIPGGYLRMLVRALVPALASRRLTNCKTRIRGSDVMTSERATTQVFGLSLTAVFVGLLVLNALTF